MNDVITGAVVNANPANSVVPLSDDVLTTNHRRRSSGNSAGFRRSSSTVAGKLSQRNDDVAIKATIQADKEFSQLLSQLQLYRSTSLASRIVERNEFDGKCIKHLIHMKLNKKVFVFRFVGFR